MKPDLDALTDAPRITGASDAPRFHVVRVAGRVHVLVVPHSRLFEVDEDFARDLELGSPEASSWLDRVCETAPGEAPLDLAPLPSPQSLSLNVSSSCNLSCGYCYAAQGAFGGAQASTMSWPTAKAAIDRLLANADPSAPITIGFLGGEPFANAALVRQCVDYAAWCGEGLGRDVRFAVTTNGTLLRDADRDLLRRRRFAVTVSVDGSARLHDRQRPAPGGASSFDAMLAGVRDLLAFPGRARLAARATVTRRSLDVEEAFDAIIAAGFPEAGFSPLRGSPSGTDALEETDWPAYLEACVRLGRRELAAAIGGGEIRFTNLAVGLKEVHRGASSPYPCGAGGGYFSVASDGRWYACHRAIGDPAYELGDSARLDAKKRLEFVASHHVHSKTECRSCWARYLCSGSCHQERRTAASCDFIRAWLEFVIEAHARLSSARPDWFRMQEPS